MLWNLSYCTWMFMLHCLANDININHVHLLWTVRLLVTFGFILRGVTNTQRLWTRRFPLCHGVLLMCVFSCLSSSHLPSPPNPGLWREVVTSRSNNVCQASGPSWRTDRAAGIRASIHTEPTVISLHTWTLRAVVLYPVDEMIHYTLAKCITVTKDND